MNLTAEQIDEMLDDAIRKAKQEKQGEEAPESSPA